MERAAWDPWTPLPNTALAREYFTSEGQVTESGRAWIERGQLTVAAAHRGCRRAAWVKLGKALPFTCVLVLLCGAMAVALGVVVGLLAAGVLVWRLASRLREAARMARSAEEARAYVAETLCTWAQMTEAERDQARAVRRRQRRKDLAAGAVVAPFLVAAAALKLLRLDGLVAGVFQS